MIISMQLYRPKVMIYLSFMWIRDALHGHHSKNATQVISIAINQNDAGISKPFNSTLHLGLAAFNIEINRLVLHEYRFLHQIPTDR